jgi:hypothetical protein
MRTETTKRILSETLEEIKQLAVDYGNSIINPKVSNSTPLVNPTCKEYLRVKIISGHIRPL